MSLCFYVISVSRSLSGYYKLANTLREVAASYNREAEQIASRMLFEDQIFYIPASYFMRSLSSAI